jgi:hypothetical protein
MIVIQTVLALYEEWEVLFQQMLMAERDILPAGRPSRPASLNAGVAGQSISRP